MIKVRELRKVIGNRSILDIPELAFEDGKICGIIGKNGSGKSTLLRILLDLERPTAGEVLIDNVSNITDESWKIKVGAYLDEDFLINFLLPEEYFELLFKLRYKNLKCYDDFVLLTENFFSGEILGQKKTIGTFSKGNRQKIGLAGALIGDVKTLILDEPFSHLDQHSQIELKRILLTLNKENGVTVILTSHDLSMTVDFFETVTTIHEGRILLKETVTWP